MPDTAPVIQRALTGPSTGGSFEREQRELIWRRCRLLFASGLAVTLIAGLVYWFVPSADPKLQSPLLRVEWLDSPLLHAGSFAVALTLLHVLCKRERRFLLAIAFGTLGFNLVLLVFDTVAFFPSRDVYFGVALMLYLSAAFIPWRPGYQVALAAATALWFLGLHFLLFQLLPEFRQFWDHYALTGAAAQTGLELARNHSIWGLTGIAILGGTSALVSSTLYSLHKTAHKAKRLGKYVIHDEIGAGGMGRVFYAQHSLLCRPTAVKVLHPGDGDQSTALARFEREVKLSATLTHPNTITIYDVGRTPDQSLFYAMEYLEGLDLEDLVERFGPVSPARTIHVLRQACGSLAEAHSRDIVHRDIKPSNIFLTRRGGLYDFVKVLDFGLAKQIGNDSAAAITKTGIMFGTPRYLAPETVYGSDKIDGRSDIYCLGGVAYWMLTGQPPFTAGTSVEVMIDHVKTAPRPPSEVSEVAIPRELDEIVMKCLEKKPSARFQTAWELESALCSVPIDEPWSRLKAEEWWRLHGILPDHPLDAECFFDGSDAEVDDRVTPLAPQRTA